MEIKKDTLVLMIENGEILPRLVIADLDEMGLVEIYDPSREKGKRRISPLFLLPVAQTDGMRDIADPEEALRIHASEVAKLLGKIVLYYKATFLPSINNHLGVISAQVKDSLQSLEKMTWSL